MRAVALAIACLLAPAAAAALDAGDVSLRVEVVATGLNVPWALAFTPDGRILVTERPGTIRVVSADGVLDPEPWAVVPGVAHRNEGGLMGVAVHPDFPREPFVFVYHTYQDGSLMNRLVRFTEVNGRGANATVLLDRVPGGSVHDGGRLKFGPDGFLYFTAGDAGDASTAQNPRSAAGKFHRVAPDGRVPADNPFPDLGSWWSWGHRNPQGLAWHPENGHLYGVEHGDSAFDEVNVILPGRNYGWPVLRGPRGVPDVAPGSVADWSPTIAPSGAAFLDRDGHAWDDQLFVVTLKERDVRRLSVDPADPYRVEQEEILLDGQFGRLREVVQGPDGHLYVTTSNRDGRGSPAADDDKVLRLIID